MDILEDISRRGFLKGAGAAAGLGAVGGALAQSSGPSATYGSKIVAAIRPHITQNKEIAGNPSVEYDVYCDANGTIIDIKLRKASGNDYWDEVALNALRKTKQLPPDINDYIPSRLTIALEPKSRNQINPNNNLSYSEKLMMAVKPNIALAKDLPGNPLVEYDVYCDPSGTILDIKLRKASGDSYWDEVALNALRKTKQLPLDGNGRIPSPITFALRPK